ncbi:MAG: DUF5908 family protein [Bacteroidota bacterium]
MPIEIFNLIISAKVRERSEPEQEQQQQPQRQVTRSQGHAEQLLERVEDMLRRRKER